MRAYIVKAEAPVWKFSEESAVEGKGRFERTRGEQMYTEILLDPVGIANGHALDPELWTEGFPYRMWSAAKKGYFVFYEEKEYQTDNDYQFIAIHGSHLEVH